MAKKHRKTLTAARADEKLNSHLVKYAKIIALSDSLTSTDNKELVRDTQYELNFSWKFFMGLGLDKQALVFVDGFTTLPLAIARNCAHVVVVGLAENEVELLQNVAAAKQISNYSCLDRLSSLASQVDLIVASGGSADRVSVLPEAAEIQKFIHPGTEFWIIARNELSLGYAKSLLWPPRKMAALPNGEHQQNGHTPVRMSFCNLPVLRSRQAKGYLNRVGCKPFAQVAVVPAISRLKLGRNLRNKKNNTLSGNLVPVLQRLKTRRVVIGARASATNKNFLERFFHHLEDLGLAEGYWDNYHVSAGGKVLLFSKVKRAGQDTNVLIKLPLNEFTLRRLNISQRQLNFFALSEKIGESRRMFFPEPIAEGEFERQPFFVESILSGRSGDAFQVPRGDREHLIHEIFSFWLGIQQSLATSYYFDDETFGQLVEAPLRRVFAFADIQNEYRAALDGMLKFLQKKLLHREFLLSLIHGDFSVKNIILNEYVLRIKGIIDWDMARDLSFPVLDLFHFFLRLQKMSYFRSPIQILQAMLEKPESTDQFLSIFQMYRESFGVEKEVLPALSIIYWLNRISGHLGSLKFIDKPFMRRNFVEPIKLFEKIIENA